MNGGSRAGGASAGRAGRPPLWPRPSLVQAAGACTSPTTGQAPPPRSLSERPCADGGPRDLETFWLLSRGRVPPGLVSRPKRSTVFGGFGASR